MQQLSGRVQLVRAPNPSPMTLEGTNTYLVGAGDEVLVIDPGPADPAHVGAVRDALAGRTVAAILLTHRHHDHSHGIAMFVEAFDVPAVLGFGGPDAFVNVPVADGARAGAGGTFLTTLHTPGHAPDHVCFVLEEERAVFSGDHVLGRGTTVIVWPEGDMAAYIEGVERLQQLAPRRIFPGHGPVIDKPSQVLEYYLTHRSERERQIVEALRAGEATPAELVARIYTDVDRSLHKVAELSVRAHLVKLAREGRAEQRDGDVWFSATGS